MRTYVDKNGEPIASYSSLASYKTNNILFSLSEVIVYNEGGFDYDILLITKFSGLVCAYKTILICEENENIKYHGIIRETDGEQFAIDAHNAIKALVLIGADIPDPNLGESF